MRAPLFARLATLASLATFAAPGTAPAQQSPAAPRPTLIVFITVDQLRPDYLSRFAPQLTGGLGRLYRGGAVFTDAYQDHAITETAPGHASTLSGRFPRSTGIVTNTAGVYDPQAPLVAAHGAGTNGPPASPFRFRGSTLTDWLRTADPRSRALSISRKDRGAILPMGRAKQNVYWYDGDANVGPAGAPGGAGSPGGFTTSRYYADTLPTWLNAFNAAHPIAAYAGRVWTPLLDAGAYPEPDSVRAEHGGEDVAFPHTLPRSPSKVVWELTATPWMDELTLAAALAGARSLGIGEGPQTDVLAVSLSTTDAIGHRYGPDSKELHDQVLRLDRYLGAFLDSIYATHDSTRVVVALTADHGVAPYPGVATADRARPAAASFVNAWTLAAPTRAALAARGVDTAAFRFADGLLQVDRAELARAGVNADSAVGAFAAALLRAPGVMRAETMAAMARRDTTRDVIARRWLHMIPPDLDVALVVTAQPYDPWGDASMANHGSPHDYDAHVPVIFYGAPFKPGRYTRMARVVDMAPTLAAVAGVKPTETLDGRVLQEALK
ncbi:MAG TPA: alkaline phosphatase family protein [Gemmatimonadaceae bacterium]|nr:alkaline phosphatase family protein [Gemmatimonadaceae bacterium]